MPQGVTQELADQKRRGILSGLLREALRERRNITFRKIQFHTLQAMDGKENNAGGEGLSALDLRGQIVERSNIDSAQAKSFT